jgi:hypothetical protein
MIARQTRSGVFFLRLFSNYANNPTAGGCGK